MARYYIREIIYGEKRINPQITFDVEEDAHKAANKMPCAECIIDRHEMRTIKIRLVPEFNMKTFSNWAGLRA